jgi:hypothetical protein
MPGDPIPTFKTQAEAEQWFTKNKITKYANFGNLDARIIQDIADSFGKNLAEFPRLKGKMRFVGSAQARIDLQMELVEQERRSSLAQFHPDWTEVPIRTTIEQHLKAYDISIMDNAYAISYSGYQYADLTGVVVNEKYGSSYTKMRDMLLNDVKQSFHPFGCGSPGAVMDHELGHQIDSLLKLTNRKATQSFADKELKRIFSKTKLDRWFNIYETKEEACKSLMGHRRKKAAKA